MSSNNVIDVSSCGDACPVCRKRARLQPANGHMADVVGPSNTMRRFMGRGKACTGPPCKAASVGGLVRRGQSARHPLKLHALPVFWIEAPKFFITSLTMLLSVC